MSLSSGSHAMSMGKVPFFLAVRQIELVGHPGIVAHIQQQGHFKTQARYDIHIVLTCSLFVAL